MLLELVHRRHHARLIDRASEVVEPVQQRHTIVNAIGDVFLERNIRNREARITGVARHREGDVRRTEIGCPKAVDIDTCASRVRTRYVIGKSEINVLTTLRDNRTDHRIVVDEAGRLLGIAPREETLVTSAVVGKVMGDRANDRVLVRTGGVSRHQLADIQSRHLGGNGMEITTIVRRGVGLHVVHFHVRWPTRQPDEDDRRIGCSGIHPRLSPHFHHIRQSQTTHSEGTDLEKVASGGRTGTARCRANRHGDSGGVFEAGLQLLQRLGISGC